MFKKQIILLDNGKRHEETFNKEDIKMANKYINRYPIPLAIRKKKIKTTLRYHYTIQIAKIKNSATPKAGKDVNKRDHIFLAGGTVK